MKAKTKCVNCKVDIIFTKKDVRPLTKKEQKLIDESNEFWQKELERKEMVKTGLFKKEKQYHFRYKFIRDAIKANIRNPIGILKCPICNSEQYILHKYS